MCEDLKIAVEKHKRSEDPIPYLTGVLINYDYPTKLKISAQICSYTILFNENLESGVECFMIIIKTQQLKMTISDIIAVRTFY